MPSVSNSGRPECEALANILVGLMREVGEIRGRRDVHGQIEGGPVAEDVATASPFPPGKSRQVKRG
jgi:hypothetical protein